MEHNIPSQIQLKSHEYDLLGAFIDKEIQDGATAVGIYGGRTYKSSPKGDIDVAVIKEGSRRGGEIRKEGVIHALYVPPNYANDPIATFANDVIPTVSWIWRA